MIRTIIIDDEPLATDALTIILKSKCSEDVEIIATSNSAQTGRKLIEQHQPDLVFLDIEMPGMSGIDLVRSFPDPGFKVVFITAYNTYAIEALRLSAMDYLLKPVETNELVSVVTKVKQEKRNNGKDLVTLLDNLEKLFSSNKHGDSKIGVAMADKIVFIDINEILYCEANGVYTRIYLVDGKKLLASKPLGEFQEQLNTKNFFRIHHSLLINMRWIKEYQRFNGGYVVMQNNIKLEVSHRKRKDFLDCINGMVV